MLKMMKMIWEIIKKKITVKVDVDVVLEDEEHGKN